MPKIRKLRHDSDVGARRATNQSQRVGHNGKVQRAIARFCRCARASGTQRGPRPSAKVIKRANRGDIALTFRGDIIPRVEKTLGNFYLSLLLCHVQAFPLRMGNYSLAVEARPRSFAPKSLLTIKCFTIIDTRVPAAVKSGNTLA